MEAYNNPYTERRRTLLNQIGNRTETKQEQELLEELWLKSQEYAEQKISEIIKNTEKSSQEIKDIPKQKEISIHTRIAKTTRLGRELLSLYKQVRQINKELNEEAKRRSNKNKKQEVKKQ